MARKYSLTKLLGSVLTLFLGRAALGNIDKVHLVFSNHLDIGFDGIAPVLGLDNHVINRYFDVYFPRARATALSLLRNSSSSSNYVWMTHSYLVSLFLDCPHGDIRLRCPNSTQVEDFVDSVRSGYISWHALPHNAQMEVFDPELLRYAIQMTHDLDQRFGLPYKQVISQRDVPGFTRNAIPILSGMGVKAVSVGVNTGSAPPAVPHNTLFRWTDAPTNTELLAMWHAGGYSGKPVDSYDECVNVENVALCNAWRGDNAGPHTPNEVETIFSAVQSAFPGATVQASTFEAFLEDALKALTASALEDLPVVTSEIGDTWIHGIASDAAKLSEFRSLLRMRRSMRWDDTPEFHNFSRMLVKIPEHTWGVDIKTFLHDFENWGNGDFHAVQHTRSNYINTVASWIRQRKYLNWALDALGPSPLLKSLRKDLAELKNTKSAFQSDSDRFELPINWENLQFTSHAWTMKLDNSTGAITSLRRVYEGCPTCGADWASPSSPLGAVTYSAYTESDFNVIWEEYMYAASWWFYKDFGKVNCSLHAPTRRQDVKGDMKVLGVQHQEGEEFKISLQLAFPEWSVEEYGACQSVWIDIISPRGDDNLFFDVICKDKTATRLPESMWVTWAPPEGTVELKTWELMKLGRPISPLDVVINGSHSLHAVGDEGIRVTGKQPTQMGQPWERLNIRSLDAALVSPGQPTPFPRVSGEPDLTAGMSFNLFNNIWATNYVMWQPYTRRDADYKFRFVLGMDNITAMNDQMMEVTPVARKHS